MLYGQALCVFYESAEFTRNLATVQVFAGAEHYAANQPKRSHPVPHKEQKRQLSGWVEWGSNLRAENSKQIVGEMCGKIDSACVK